MGSGATRQDLADAVVSYIEERRGELAELLSALIQIRSVFPPGEYGTLASRDA